MHHNRAKLKEPVKDVVKQNEFSMVPVFGHVMHIMSIVVIVLEKNCVQNIRNPEEIHFLGRLLVSLCNQAKMVHHEFNYRDCLLLVAYLVIISLRVLLLL